MFRLNIKTDNAAFEEHGPGAEIARILRRAADDAERGVPEGSLWDVNGNKVGSFSWKED